MIDTAITHTECECKIQEYNNIAHKLNFIVYKKYLEDSHSDALLHNILSEPRNMKYPLLTKAGQPSKKRNGTIYGDIKEYIITYRGQIIKKPVYPLNSEFKELRNKITETTEQNYNTCALQIYNSGVVGIKPHRDKEMNAGSKIASISLGESRVMRFERSGFEPLDIMLDKGDLCVINYPTNNYWLHSIPADETTQVRASLIYRNFEV
jgi:alkylated DNA repair dioxygenase AlkB